MESGSLTTGEFIGISLVFLSLMILPGVIAYYTNHRRKRLIAIVSLLLGWTVFVSLFTLTMVIAQSNFKHSKIANLIWKALDDEGITLTNEAELEICIYDEEVD